MTEHDQRIAIAAFDGWTGCSDSDCDYRKCHHLHKGIVIGFPEPFCTSRYPDYLHDLNAVHEVEKMLTAAQKESFAQMLTPVAKLSDIGIHNWQSDFEAIHSTAPQRCEAFLRTIGK